MKEYKLITSSGCDSATDFNPCRSIETIWINRSLIHALVKRQLAERYRGSFLGAAWTVVTPLLFLLIYTFVFSTVMKAKWGVLPDEGGVQFAMALFCGLIPWGIFSETTVQAPTLILSNPSYVTKTVFPLEVLSVVSVLSAAARSLAGVLILMAGVTFFAGGLNWTVVLFIIPLAGAVMLSMGISWFLASLGVFVRDCAHTVSVLVSLLFFLTPIVYPLPSVPQRLRPLFYLNPFTHIVESSRNVVIWGRMPDWPWLLTSLAISAVIFYLSHVFFMKTKRTFADVI